MIDADAFLVLSVVALGLMPFLTARGRLPRVLSGPELRLETLDEGQSRYEAGLPFRRAVRWGTLALLVYFVVRAALAPPARLQTETFPAYVACVGLAVASGSLAAVVWRYRWDRRFAAEHPLFADSVQPLGLRLLGPLLVLVCFALITASAWVQRGEFVAVGLGGAMILFLLGQRALLTLVVRTQIPVSPESALGRLTTEAVVLSGFTPKRTILVPSTVANAFALADGTVMVTTALRAVASDAEVAAILAHELSHVRDRDLKRLRRASLVGISAMVLFALTVCLPMVLLPGSGSFFVPIVVLAVVNGIQIALLTRTGISRKLEFKCDRAAAALGFGKALGEGLVKMYRYNGAPRRWSGYEGRIVTHPSLDDRLTALAEAVGEYPRP